MASLENTLRCFGVDNYGKMLGMFLSCGLESDGMVRMVASYLTSVLRGSIPGVSMADERLLCYRRW